MEYHDSWKQVDIVIFKNTTGVAANWIARAGPDSANSDRFAEQLSRRIREARRQQA